MLTRKNLTLWNHQASVISFLFLFNFKPKRLSETIVRTAMKSEHTWHFSWHLPTHCLLPKRAFIAKLCVIQRVCTISPPISFTDLQGNSVLTRCYVGTRAFFLGPPKKNVILNSCLIPLKFLTRHSSNWILHMFKAIERCLVCHDVAIVNKLLCVNWFFF